MSDRVEALIPKKASFFLVGFVNRLKGHYIKAYGVIARATHTRRVTNPAR